jgi:hypothetical protein
MFEQEYDLFKPTKGLKPLEMHYGCKFGSQFLQHIFESPYQDHLGWPQWSFAMMGSHAIMGWEAWFCV